MTVMSSSDLFQFHRSFQFWPNNKLLSTCRVYCFPPRRRRPSVWCTLYVEVFVGPSGMTLTTSELDDIFFVNFPGTNSIVCHSSCAVFCPHAQFLHSLWIPASGCTAARKFRRTVTSLRQHTSNMIEDFLTSTSRVKHKVEHTPRGFFSSFFVCLSVSMVFLASQLMPFTPRNAAHVQALKFFQWRFPVFPFTPFTPV